MRPALISTLVQCHVFRVGNSVRFFYLCDLEENEVCSFLKSGYFLRVCCNSRLKPNQKCRRFVGDLIRFASAIGSISVAIVALVTVSSATTASSAITSSITAAAATTTGSRGATSVAFTSSCKVQIVAAKKKLW